MEEVVEQKPINSVAGLIGAKRVAKTFIEKHEVKVITRKKEKLLGKAEDLADEEVSIYFLKRIFA